MSAPHLGRAVSTAREILALDAPGADRLLDRLEAEVPVSTPVVSLPGTGIREAIVLGDTHGDWRSAEAGADLFLAEPEHLAFVGLGDYIDRPPEDSPNGSVANALFLLGLQAAFPDRVILLQGNHETSRRFPVLPHSLAEEVDDLWGPEEERYRRILGLLERGPFAATAPNGPYLAHASFPRTPAGRGVAELFATDEEDAIFDTVWRSSDASRIRRGGIPSYTESELVAFLSRIGASCQIRGHDPDLAGKVTHGDRSLTLHSTRLFERYGGVLAARLPLDRAIHSAREIPITHLRTEGRSFEGGD